jgi:hypothetical protein
MCGEINGIRTHSEHEDEALRRAVLGRVARSTRTRVRLRVQVERRHFGTLIALNELHNVNICSRGQLGRT